MCFLFSQLVFFVLHACVHTLYIYIYIIVWTRYRCLVLIRDARRCRSPVVATFPNRCLNRRDAVIIGYLRHNNIRLQRSVWYYYYDYYEWTIITMIDGFSLSVVIHVEKRIKLPMTQSDTTQFEKTTMKR